MYQLKNASNSNINFDWNQNNDNTGKNVNTTTSPSDGHKAPFTDSDVIHYSHNDHHSNSNEQQPKSRRIPTIHPNSTAGKLFPHCLALEINLTKEVRLPQWVDIDFNRKSSCGKYKCFFQSRSYPNTVGYVVAFVAEDQQENPSSSSSSSLISVVFNTMVQAADLEDTLQHKFPGVSVGKLPSEQPQTVHNTSQDMWCLLLFMIRPDNYNPKKPKDSRFYYRLPGNTNIKPQEQSNEQHEHHTVVIQRVRKAPTPSTLLGPSAKIESFLRRVVPKENLKEFHKTLENDVQIFQQMLHFDNNLYNDVQVMVDTKGHLFHVDTDLAFQKRGRAIKVSKRSTTKL